MVSGLEVRFEFALLTVRSLMSITTVHVSKVHVLTCDDDAGFQNSTMLFASGFLLYLSC